MPPKKKFSRHLNLTAGEECTLSGSGLIQITLKTGVLDVAGATLELDKAYNFYLHQGRQCIVVFTLEGGSCVVASDVKVDCRREVARAGRLVQLTRRNLLGARRTKTLVIGRPGSGKTLAAHTIANLLLRYGSDKRAVYLMDLNAESNCLSAPGCITAMPVPETPLWPGQTANPALLPLSLCTGAAVRPSADTAGSLLHYYDQLHETMMSYIQELRGASTGVSSPSSPAQLPSEIRAHVVIDAPSPLSDLQEGVWYRKLIELLKPSHVVLVGARSSGAEEDWGVFLQEDVQRGLPDCEFVFTEAVAQDPGQGRRAELLREYFVGTPFYSLGCSKVVIPLKALTFVEEADGEEPVSVRTVQPDASFRGLVCALSHAELMEEVPLAPVAGLMAIVYVDMANEEVALLIPAAEEPLMRRIVVIPHAKHRETLRMTEADITALEEVVAV